jgi:hypothetical protein
VNPRLSVGKLKIKYLRNYNEETIVFYVYDALDRLCGLVVRVPGYRSRGPGFDSRRYQIIWEVVGLEQVPLSLVNITEELHEWKLAAPGLKKN